LKKCGISNGGKNILAFAGGMIRFPTPGSFSFNNWMGKFSIFKDNLIKQFKGGKNQLNIKLINNLLFVCIFILTFYFIHNFISSFKKINNIDFPIASSVSPGATSQDVAVFKAISFYIPKIEKRDIFKMGPRSSPEYVVEVISSKAAEATKNLRLVGISWSDDPDVMIEDIKQAKTFFVKKGQMLGDVKVESIAKDKVILRYGEESIEMR
jgi:hypothetical protein